MLKCIPVLREFHHVPDEETRELIVTMAVILRQFEEIDVDVDENDLVGRKDDADGGARVNFLSVINAVLRTSRFEDFFKDSELLKASYWVALRQEVYYALSKGHTPQMAESPQQWDVVSPANRLIVHTSRVAGWLANGKSVEGYSEFVRSSQPSMTADSHRSRSKRARTHLVTRSRLTTRADSIHTREQGNRGGVPSGMVQILDCLDEHAALHDLEDDPHSRITTHWVRNKYSYT